MAAIADCPQDYTWLAVIDYRPNPELIAFATDKGAECTPTYLEYIRDLFSDAFIFSL